jgi:predicted AlkP superfamily pyrophosphatase or phosphodiesterase
MAARSLKTLRISPFLLAGMLFSSSLHAQPAEELVITPQAHKGALAVPVARPKAGAVASPVRGPKLVLVLVADQFRADTITRYRSLLGNAGLLRLARGATAVGHHGQQNTYTGPGQALIATGAYGYLNGVTQNKWFNRATGRSEAMMFDPESRVLGEKDGGPEEETSPRNLVGTTLFDELRMANSASKVIAVALKGRGSLLLGGQLGQSYFFSDQFGGFTSSSFYGSELPEWVRRWNARKPADAAFGQKWERLLPAQLYQGSDDAPYEGEVKGMGKTFPHALTGGLSAPGPAFYEAITHAPTGIDLEIDFALSAMAEEQLGQRGVTDVLAVSISGTDLAGHIYGPFSHEYQDMVARLDRGVARLLGEIDKRFTASEVVILFTADHGAVPIPEALAQQRLLAGRIKKANIKAVVNKALSERFGAGEWVVALEDPSIYLDANLVAKAKVDPQLIEEEAGKAALTLPGMIGFMTRTQILRGAVPPTEAARAVVRSYFPPRGGDVVLLTAPYYFWGKYGEKAAGSTHGSFYRYDTDVPVMLVGSGFVPGQHGVIEMVDVAATLAQVLNLTPPPACEGRPVLRMIRSVP